MIVSKLRDEIHLEADKDWLISAARNLEPEKFALTLLAIVIVKAVSKLAGIVANDVVRARIVPVGSAENMNTDMVFRQRISPSGQGAFADVAQKTR